MAMKNLLRHLAVFSLALAALCGCKHGRTLFGGSPADTLCVDSFKYSRTDSVGGSVVSVEINADYPSPITGPLSAGIAAWIRGGISEEAVAADTMDGQKVVDFLGGRIFDNYMSMAGEYASDMDYAASAKLVCKRRNYVSFLLSVYEYTGGAHGMYTVSGGTFSQTDGRLYGWELLQDTASEGFRRLLKDGVRGYLSKDNPGGELTDAELCEILLLNMDGSPATAEQLGRFPLPATPPYFTRKGVAFVYQSYEIAPYAMGLPAFEVSFKNIGRYLSGDGRRLLEKSGD